LEGAHTSPFGEAQLKKKHHHHRQQQQQNKKKCFTSSDPRHDISKHGKTPYLFSGLLRKLILSCPLLSIPLSLENLI